MTRVPWRRILAGAATMAVVAATVSACSSESGLPTLTFYALPDNGGVPARAEKCAAASHNAYKVHVEVLPSNPTSQREQMVRRLAAHDSSIDVLGIDVVYVAEFANAGFLRPFTDSEQKATTAGMLPAPIKTGMWDSKLYAVPMTSNAQLLFYRKAAVRAAGVDPNSPDFTWDTMIKAAESAHKTVAEQGGRYEGYAVWVNALILSAGGQVLTDADKGRDAKPGLDGPAGVAAAKIIGGLARSSAAPADLSTAMEEQSRSTFQSSKGMFMPNWPYVLAAARSAVKSGSLDQSVVDDIGWARYPKVRTDHDSAPPLGGANLAIGAFSKHPELASALVRCMSNPTYATQYMLDEGNPSPYAVTYDDPKVRTEYPDADLIRESIADGGARPMTPYYVDVTGSIVASWHAPNAVTESTPGASAKFMSEVLSGRRLL
ncbi:MAG: extracellular solute-binding protein [Gordonia sp. (in: high G+C Gram-positive bacteria)]